MRESRWLRSLLLGGCCTNDSVGKYWEGRATSRRPSGFTWVLGYGCGHILSAALTNAHAEPACTRRRRPCRSCALRRTPAVAVVARTRTWWSRAMMQAQPTTRRGILQPQLLHPDRPHAAMTETPALQSRVIVHVRRLRVWYAGCVAFLVIVATRWGIYQKYSLSLIVVLVDLAAWPPSLPPSSVRCRCLSCRRNTARCPSHV